MAADVAAFESAIDKAYGNFSTVDAQPEFKESRRYTERDRREYLERRFQEQLQRARAAFLQEFRNHSVVVECEVRKIREELTQKLEEKYGEKMEQLRRQSAESEALAQKLRDEVAHLKGLVTAQESYLVAARHHCAQEDKMGIEINRLRLLVQEKTDESSGLLHQLTCRDELVAQLGGELSTLETEMKRQVGDFAQEKREHDDLLRGLRAEVKQQREQFESRLGAFQEQFEEYKAKSTAELRVQEILNGRRAEALRNMEEERQRHIVARTKPSQRIGAVASSASAVVAVAPVANPMHGSAAPMANPMLGSAPPAGVPAVGVATTEAQQSDSEARYEQYLLAKDTRYRVDEMGMDTAWRDYRLNDSQPASMARKSVPKFRVERARKANPFGQNAPVATDETLRPHQPARLRQLEMPQMPAMPHTAR